MYFRPTIFIFLPFLAAGEGVGANELTLDFDHMDAQIAPVGFTQARTGRGGTGVWEIKEDKTAPSGFASRVMGPITWRALSAGRATALGSR